MAFKNFITCILTKLFENNPCIITTFRLYTGPLKVHEDKTIEGKKFQMINLPFNLIPRIKKILEFVSRNNLGWDKMHNILYF